MPRVILDNQIFTSQQHGGVSRYFAELLRHRDSLGQGIELDLRLSITANEYLDASAGFRGLRVIPQTGLGGRVVRRAIFYLGSVPPRRYRSYDLIHHTFYRPEVLRRSPTSQRVSTLHDMIPELRPEYFPSGNPHGAKRLYLERSDVIISVSQASADEMLDYWPHLEEKEIVIVPLGVGEAFLGDGLAFTPAVPYLLYVGNRGGYKNFSVMLQALAISRHVRGFHLIAAGGGAFSSAEISQIRQLGLEDRVYQRRASDAELASLYRGAAAFVFPSMHEGFGLPTLEALACGCPVILSDIPVFHEVAGDAATYFDPRSAESLAGALGILQDVRACETARVRGRKRAKAQSWAEVAARTGSAYKRLL